MARLLQLEFRRLLKDKLILAVAIIIVVIAILNSLFVVSIDAEFLTDEYRDMMLRDTLTSSFQLSSTPYIVIGLATVIFIAKDISQGTIRNKLIAGFSKLEIYFSTLIVASVFTLVIMFLFHGTILGFSAAFGVNVYVDSTVVHDLDNFIIYGAIGYLLLLVASSMIVLIGLIVKNMAGAIVLSIVLLTFILALGVLIEGLLEYTLIYQRYDLYLQAQEAENARRELHKVLDYFYIFQALKYSTTMFNPTDATNYYSQEGGAYLIKVLATNTGLLTLINVGGAFLFRKTDLK